MQAQAMYSDSSSILTLEMHFAIGSPTALRAGTWRWTRNNQMLGGTIGGRSVTFLGGQDGPPSIGGTYDLLDQNGEPRYRVVLPVTALQGPWHAPPEQN
jgi:hypothetical protein